MIVGSNTAVIALIIVPVWMWYSHIVLQRRQIISTFKKEKKSAFLVNVFLLSIMFAH